MSSLTACGSGSTGGSPVLDWYVAPARADEATLARSCADASSGAYRVRVHALPVDADERHTDLVRRLSADNDSVDVVAVDTASIAELAEAGFLARFSTAQQDSFASGMAPGAVAAGTVDGRLAAAPWWFDPQLLFYRGVVAERAGLDVSKPISWDDLVAGAARLGTTVQIADVDGRGIAAWVSALTALAGGAVVDDRGEPQLDSDGVRTAAAVVQLYAQSGVGPGTSSDALTDFAGTGGGFLVAPSSALSDEALRGVSGELGFAAYPDIAGSEGSPPAAGMSLSIARDSSHPRQAAAFIECLQSPEAQQSLVVNTGHGAARLATYAAETVGQDSPTAELVASALEQAQDVSASAAWTPVRRAIDEVWSPADSVNPGSTPRDSQRVAADLVDGRLP